MSDPGPSSEGDGLAEGDGEPPQEGPQNPPCHLGQVEIEEEAPPVAKQPRLGEGVGLDSGLPETCTESTCGVGEDQGVVVITEEGELYLLCCLAFI